MTDTGREALIKSIDGGRANVEALSLDGIGPASGYRPEDLEGHAICIDYRDTEGGKSRRWISMHRVEAGHESYIEGYCWKRKQSRTFRIDRISSVMDMDGECLDAGGFFAAFGFSLKAKTKVAARPRKAVAKAELAASADGLYAARNFGKLKPSDEIPEWKKRLNDHLVDLPHHSPSPEPRGGFNKLWLVLIAACIGMLVLTVL